MKKLWLSTLVISAMCFMTSCACAANGIMQIRSSAFAADQRIPDLYTCVGENISPELLWQNIPTGTKSLTLIVDDPDAPGGTFTHWIAYNIPANWPGLPAGHVNGFKTGKNSFNKLGYGGPCPPKGDGQHRYVFKLYALDKMLDLPANVDRDTIINAIGGHTIGRTQFMGTFDRP